MILVLCLVFSGAITAEAQQWIDYRHTKLIQTESHYLVADFVCPSTGLYCNGCKNKVLCVNTNGNFTAQSGGSCPDKEYCNNGKCFPTPPPECSTAAKKSFVCNSMGVFPDPADCHKFHFCISSSANPSTMEHHFERSCDPSWAFDPRSGYCSRQLNGIKCSGSAPPVPVCREFAQTSALRDNPSIYYVCLPYDEDYEDVLYPFLFACPNGKSYNDRTFNCR